MNGKSRKRHRRVLPSRMIEKTDDNWPVHELKYWEQTFDRMRAELLDVQSAHDTWKQAHENALKQIQQWESWYKDLESNRNYYQQWDSDKKTEISRLKQSIDELKKAIDIWKDEHGKVVVQIEQRSKEFQSARVHWDADHKHMEEVIHQWKGWNEGLEKDRDLYKQWDADKKIEIDRLNKFIDELQRSVGLWKGEHGKVVERLEQISMEFHQARIRWDADNKAEAARLGKIIDELRGANEVWKGEHGKVVEQVVKISKEFQQARGRWEADQRHMEEVIHQWKGWNEGLEKERNLYKQWNADNKADTARLGKIIDELKGTNEVWKGEHGKVVEQVVKISREFQQARGRWDADQKHMEEVIHQWEVWYKGIEDERERYRIWDLQKQKEIERKDSEIQELHRWIDALLRNPVRYLKEFVGTLLSSKK